MLRSAVGQRLAADLQLRYDWGAMRLKRPRGTVHVLKDWLPAVAKRESLYLIHNSTKYLVWLPFYNLGPVIITKLWAKMSVGRPKHSLLLCSDPTTTTTTIITTTTS